MVYIGVPLIWETTKKGSGFRVLQVKAFPHFVDANAMASPYLKGIRVQGLRFRVQGLGLKGLGCPYRWEIHPPHPPTHLPPQTKKKNGKCWDAPIWESLKLGAFETVRICRDYAIERCCIIGASTMVLVLSNGMSHI